MADEKNRGEEENTDMLEQEERSDAHDFAEETLRDDVHESSDAAYGSDDSLETDSGVSNEEVHPEHLEQDAAADDGIHGADQEHVSDEPALPVHEDLGPAKNWYIVHAYSGFENKVAESLRTRSEAFGFADRLGQILIPTEEVIELRNGKKVTSKRMLYPGYVLVEMEMNDELWHAVKSTPRVTGFVGGGTKPVPLTADEVNSVLYRQAHSAERPRPKLSFEKSETVKIIDGPFTNFSGKVEEVNTERSTLRVMVTIFGRSTPVELDFLQVEKI